MENKNKTIVIIAIISIFLSCSIVVWELGLKTTNNDGISLDPIKTYAQSTINEDILNKTEFHFIDVGQGDSTLIILPNNKTMLIDGGKSKYGYTIVNYIKKLNIKKIDYLIMTHPDADHIGGINTIINNFDIGNIYMTDTISTTKTFEDLLLNIESKNLGFTTLKADDEIVLGDDFNVTVVSPVKKYEDTNEMSIVVKIIYKNNSFLLMGDAGDKAEQDILNSNTNITANLIKIGHHGSKYSSSSNFIQKVNPQYAIISVGKDNQYGHPSIEVLNILERFKVKIYRTDLQGDIIAISNGNTIEITA